MAEPIEGQLLLLDAQLLIRQYENRNADGALDAQQRKAWAAEVAEVLRRLSQEFGRIGETSVRVEIYRAWNAQFDAGQRPVTPKLKPMSRR